MKQLCKPEESCNNQVTNQIAEISLLISLLQSADILLQISF